MNNHNIKDSTVEYELDNKTGDFIDSNKDDSEDEVINLFLKQYQEDDINIEPDGPSLTDNQTVDYDSTTESGVTNFDDQDSNNSQSEDSNSDTNPPLNGDQSHYENNDISLSEEDGLNQLINQYQLNDNDVTNFGDDDNFISDTNDPIAANYSKGSHETEITETEDQIIQNLIDSYASKIIKEDENTASNTPQTEIDYTNDHVTTEPGEKNIDFEASKQEEIDSDNLINDYIKQLKEQDYLSDNNLDSNESLSANIAKEPFEQNKEFDTHLSHLAQKIDNAEEAWSELSSTWPVIFAHPEIKNKIEELWKILKNDDTESDLLNPTSSDDTLIPTEAVTPYTFNYSDEDINNIQAEALNTDTSTDYLLNIGDQTYQFDINNPGNDTAIISPEAPDEPSSIEISKTFDIIDNPSIADTPGISDISHTQMDYDIPNTHEQFEFSETAGSLAENDVTEIPETAETIENPDITNEIKNSDTDKASEATEVSDKLDISEITDISDIINDNNNSDVANLIIDTSDDNVSDGADLVFETSDDNVSNSAEVIFDTTDDIISKTNDDLISYSESDSSSPTTTPYTDSLSKTYALKRTTIDKKASRSPYNLDISNNQQKRKKTGLMAFLLLGFIVIAAAMWFISNDKSTTTETIPVTEIEEINVTESSPQSINKEEMTNYSGIETKTTSEEAYIANNLSITEKHEENIGKTETYLYTEPSLPENSNDFSEQTYDEAEIILPKETVTAEIHSEEPTKLNHSIVNEAVSSAASELNEPVISAKFAPLKSIALIKPETTDTPAHQSIINSNKTKNTQSTKNKIWSLNLESIFKTKAPATKLIKSLNDRGIPAELKFIKLKGESWYRVRITGFTSKSDAINFMKEVELKTDIKKYWISYSITE